tara:strand:+ start:24854 stop:25270 length:417 start_codon:yes stop_codon:yes gene_type:complete
VGKFENSKNPEQAKGSEGKHGLGTHKKQRDVFGYGRDKIDDTVGTENVFGRLIDGYDPQYILYCKGDGNNPLGNIELVMVFLTDLINTFQGNQYHTGENKDKQDYIKYFAGTGIGLKDDLMQSVFEIFITQWFSFNEN